MTGALDSWVRTGPGARYPNYWRQAGRRKHAIVVTRVPGSCDHDGALGDQETDPAQQRVLQRIRITYSWMTSLAKAHYDDVDIAPTSQPVQRSKQVGSAYRRRDGNHTGIWRCRAAGREPTGERCHPVPVIGLNRQAGGGRCPRPVLLDLLVRATGLPVGLLTEAVLLDEQARQLGRLELAVDHRDLAPASAPALAMQRRKLRGFHREVRLLAIAAGRGKAVHQRVPGQLQGGLQVQAHMRRTEPGVAGQNGHRGCRLDGLHGAQHLFENFSAPLRGVIDHWTVEGHALGEALYRKQHLDPLIATLEGLDHVRRNGRVPSQLGGSGNGDRGRGESQKDTQPPPPMIRRTDVWTTAIIVIESLPADA